MAENDTNCKSMVLFCDILIAEFYENCGSCFAAKQFVDIKLGAKCLLTLTSFYK